MEMWRKLSTLVLFAAAALAGVMRSAQYSVVLDQTQRQERVPLGSSLDLRCILTIPQYQKLRVFFSHIGSSHNDSKEISAHVINNTSNSTGDLTFEETYSLSNVTYEHAGWYFCKVTVEIPAYKLVGSSGTRVNITTKTLVESTTHASLVTSKQAEPPEAGTAFMTWWMWAIVGVSAFALLVLLVICILLRRRCHKSRDPDPIYINTRPMVNKQPSPRPDNLKMSAASQNLPTPSPGRRYEEGNHRHQY